MLPGRNMQDAIHRETDIGTPVAVVAGPARPFVGAWAELFSAHFHAHKKTAGPELPQARPQEPYTRILTVLLRQPFGPLTQKAKTIIGYALPSSRARKPGRCGAGLPRNLDWRVQ